MIDWFRRVDPSFYHKEPHVLRLQAQIDRYPDEAQAEVRLSVLTADRMLHAVTTIVALSAYAVATGAGALDPHADPLTVWALAVLAVATPRALPWSPRTEWTRWHDALLGSVLIAIPALWGRVDPPVLGLALLAGSTLYVVRGRGRLALLAVAVGVLFGVRAIAHPLLAPAVGILAAGAAVLGVRAIARVWGRRPQVVTWSAFAALLVACAYTFAGNAPAVALRVPAAIVAIAVAYLGVCLIAGRIRRAELIARPEGVLSLPQSIVPLLDRSHHHAIICWLG